MDLATFRAQHPGLYDLAIADGIDAERERVTTHLELARAAGQPRLAEQPIKHGHSVAEAMWRYREAAAASDATAAAFARRLTELDLDTPAGSAAGEPGPQTRAAKAFAARHAGSTAPTSTGPQDLGDQVVAVLRGNGGPVRPPAAAKPPAAGDLGDQVVARMRGPSAGGGA